MMHGQYEVHNVAVFVFSCVQEVLVLMNHFIPKLCLFFWKQGLLSR